MNKQNKLNDFSLSTPAGSYKHSGSLGSPAASGAINYDLLAKQAAALIADVPYLTANLANVSALLNQELEGINWVGFYLMEDGKLVLGPFQGKPACIEIPVGKGVCGAAAARDETVLVRDVYEFPGHIACDAASRSEIVVPIHCKGKVVAVLDIDSPYVGRFTERDQEGLKKIAEVLEVMADTENDN